MDQEVPFQLSPKKGSKRSRQNTLIAVGLVMFFLSMFISAEKMVDLKVIGAMLGLCIFCVGLYLRGMKES